MIPVKPPKVKRTKNPATYKVKLFILIFLPKIVDTHEKILTPVGTAMIIVAAEKYARLSKSIPTVNM